MTLDHRHVLGALVLLAAITIGRLEWRSTRAGAPDENTSRTEIPSSPADPAPRSTAPLEAPRATQVVNTATPIATARAAGAAPDFDHPHPITPEHERLFRENRLIGAMNGAMDVADVRGLRRLLAEYRQDYPEDDQELGDGYAVIADCLESPGQAARATAERWTEAHRGSTLRRFVIRHCFASSP